MHVEVHQIPADLDLSAKQLKKIISRTCGELNLSALSVFCIFVSDDDLAEMHGTFLHDQQVTDVITFNLGENDIEGEIYISFDRARTHALQYKVTYEAEIIRLLVHALLHLAGYDDVEETSRKKMKIEEDKLSSKMLASLTF